MTRPSYVAIIPARQGSKGVPGKNVRVTNGHPLVAWSIRQALDVGAISTVILSTDGQAIADVGREYGAPVPFLRPAALAEDSTSTEAVMEHVLQWCDTNGVRFDAVILLQPTSPLRFPGSIAAAIDAFEKSKAASLLSVCASHAFFWRREPNVSASYDFTRRPRRQDIPPDQHWYRENGSIYITRREAFSTARNRLVQPIATFEMHEAESYEIDSEDDFVLVEALMKAHSVTLPPPRR